MKNIKIITFIILILTTASVIIAFCINPPKSVITETPYAVESVAPAVSETPVSDNTERSYKLCLSYLEDDLFEPNAQSGEVVNLSYYTCDTEKNMQVYLPYGYDASKQYDVVVLLHGSEGNEGYWFGQYQYYDDRPIELKNLIDNMIYWGYCDPVIIVSPTFYLNDEEREGGDLPTRDYSRMATEIREDILPAVKNAYSTYDTREHFAFIGASYGSMILYNSVLPMDLDLFSWWGAISGYDADIYNINSHLSSYGDDIGIDYFYTSAGSKDSLKKDTILGYNNMVYMCPKIDGTNICYTEIIGATHNGRVWVNGVYNCLLLFFGNDILSK